MSSIDVVISAIDDGDIIKTYLLDGLRRQAHHDFVHSKGYKGGNGDACSDGSYKITVSDIAGALKSDFAKVSPAALRKRIEKVISVLESEHDDAPRYLVAIRDGHGTVRMIRFFSRLCGSSPEKKEIAPKRVILRKAKPPDEKDYASLVNKPVGRFSREEIRGQRRGEHNESRFVQLLKSWVENAGEFLGSRHIKVRISQSKKFSDRDLRGDGVKIRVSVFKRKHECVYDVKSSREAAKKYNDSVRRLGHEKYLAFKKAIVINQYRTDHAILEEVFSDVAKYMRIVLPTPA